MLTGQLGTLSKNNRQVAGFLDWQIGVTLNSTSQAKWQAYKESGWKASAPKFWLVEKLDDDKFYAIFYQHIRDRLVIVSQLDVRVKIPNAPLNTIIIGNVEMWRA